MALRIGKGLVVLAMVAAIATLTGCETDSFIDPSRTGRFEYEPTTIPVLDRIDVIEPQEDFWERANPPTNDDLMPRELAYYIYPGDVVTVSVYELTQANVWTTSTRRVDTAGYFRVPELGDVRAAGLTAQQFEEEIKRQLRDRIMTNPQVDVVVEQSGGLRYTVYGFVQHVGQYNLDNPNLRLIDALASAGGVPTTTEHVYVIRQVILSPEVQLPFQNEQQPPSETGPRSQPAKPGKSVEDLINQLQNKPPATTNPDVRPGMMQDPPPSQPASQPAVDIDQLEPVHTPEAPPPVDVDVVKPQTQPANESNDSFIYVPERGEWVRVPGGAAAQGGQPAAPQTSRPAEPAAALSRIIDIDYQRLSRGDSSQNIVVRPNDSIYVDGPPQGFVYIDGEVGRIGVYNMPPAGTLTLSRAISAAGGLGAIAIPERVDLTRRVGNNREATIRLNLAAIRNRTEPDVVLKPDDHIIVGTNFWATPLAIFRSGLRATYGFGFILDRNFGPDVFGAQPFTF